MQSTQEEKPTIAYPRMIPYCCLEIDPAFERCGAVGLSVLVAPLLAIRINEDPGGIDKRLLHSLRVTQCCGSLKKEPVGFIRVLTLKEALPSG